MSLGFWLLIALLGCVIGLNCQVLNHAKRIKKLEDKR